MGSSSTRQSAPAGTASDSGAPSLAPGDRIEIRDGYAEIGDVRLYYVEAGDGPLVVLLHGFPEFWYGWRRQIAPLAEAGYRVVAPDLRGYNLSSKPDGIAPTAPTSWPPTSAASSGSAAPSPRSWPATIGVEPPPGRSR